MERDALRPRCFEAEPGSHPNGWIFIKQPLTPQQLENKLAATGWTFFFMAGPIRAAAFGFNREKTVDSALNRGIQGVRRLRCNCLQIESVEMRSFLGIPDACMSVRPLFRPIVYHPSVPILIVDSERNYRNASAGAGKLLGLARGRVIGQKMRIPPSGRRFQSFGALF